MPHTNLSHEGVRHLMRGAPQLRREDVLEIEGSPEPGELVELRGPDGEVLGFGDIEEDGPVAIRRIGQLHDSAEGLVPRQLRRALARRAQVVDDPRYCRVVNDEGDGLPGLVIDRFDTHFSLQTMTRAMDARIEEITRTLVEIAGARSVMLRNDSAVRLQGGLSVDRSRVLYGAPARWIRIQELGARLTVDLHQGAGTSYTYAMHEVRRTVGRLARDARVLDPSCFLGGTIIQAGMHGARQIFAYAEDPDTVDLARENVDANGVLNRAIVEEASPIDALRAVRDTFDLVLLHAPSSAVGQDRWSRQFGDLVRLSLRSTRHGGRLVIAAPDVALGSKPLESHVVEQCELEGRAAYRLLRPAAPADFPAVAGAPEALASVVLEIT